MVSIVMMVACRDEDAIRFPDLKTGVNARVSIYADRSYINLSDLNSSSIAFDIYSVNTDIEEVVYTATYTDADSASAIFPTVVAFTISGSEFISGKAAELEISASELANKFGLPGGLSYFEGNDNITFNASVKLKDGRTYDASNSAPSISGGTNASFTTAFTVYAGCPSDQEAIVGTYYAIVETNNYDPSVIGDTTEVEVTFAGPEPFRYRVSDVTGEFYVPFDGTAYPGTFYDMCGGTILQATTSGFGPIVDNTSSGSPEVLPPVITVNGDNVEFILNWHETNNGIMGAIRYVKKS